MSRDSSTPEPVVAIVAAAGSGVRLGDSSAGGFGPKALRTLAGVSLLRHSVDHLVVGGVGRCIIVCRPEHQDLVRKALRGVPAQIALADGGPSRQESVGEGLKLLPRGTEVVLVHDAARPLVPTQVVARVIDAVRAGAQAVVPVVAVGDSIRQVDGGDSWPVDRATLRAVQTPQGFAADVLVRAHREAAHLGYTDDAAICEAIGAHVELVEGSPLSMKITRPTDFAMAEQLAGLARL
ncbi:2-C-methyl-D-erythritol 4-phosphate cytidylyltransferase [Propionibacterium sp.]|uniref:2-C-methyl-D-erythritol 4-phosphate cytidylyltransferase n=1 Tax=Propionibacterium sp. TaxID=1977903 RepID=UPI0039EB7928